jgi:hypothetical protein
VPIRPLGFLANPRVKLPLLSCRASGKVPETHSVDSICDHDFGVFTVTNIATENTDAVLPAHSLPRTPKATNQGFQRCCGPSVPLTCLAPLAAWQSLCTGHVDASLENSVALAFTDGDRNAKVCQATRFAWPIYHLGKGSFEIAVLLDGHLR